MSDVQAFSGINYRVWYVEGGVHPTRTPQLLSLGKFSTDPSQKIGEAKKITAPDPNNFNRDIQVGVVPGSRDRATLGVGIRSTAQKSILLGWKNRGCRVDLYALVGKCGNPQDFSEGGEKWIYFPDGRISGHNYEGFGAFGLDESKESNSTVDMSSEEYYEFLYMTQERQGATVTTRQIYTIDVYTGNDCEDCPDPCDRVLATMAGASATPGTQPLLLYSSDGGNTWSTQSITTLFSNEEIMDGTPIGDDIVYVSNTSNSIHWSEIEMIYLGTNVWQETTNGFVAGKGPNAIWSADPRHSWIVGDGGYIYFCPNHATGVVVQDAGAATTAKLLSVHAYDTRNILAVGQGNAVVNSIDGGESWSTPVGPAVGVVLGACWMWSPTVWFVGEGAGGTGKLWLTLNSGKTWSVVSMPNTYVQIDKIRFISEAEGYISARDAGKSYILRTITAGNEWLVLPSGKAATPINNTSLTDLTVCSKYANTVWAAGLAAGAASGIIVKMTNGN
jgi:photosystem II stability/assembly factor-like uncharacterized protein